MRALATYVWTLSALLLGIVAGGLLEANIAQFAFGLNPKCTELNGVMLDDEPILQAGELAAAAENWRANCPLAS